MLGIIGKMLGSEKALTGIVGGATKALDALVYTEEEKAQDAAKARSEARGMVIKWMAATQGQNLARRFLALMIAGVWLLLYLAQLGIGIAGAWVKSPEMHEVAELVGESADGMTGAMMLILGFYFAAPHMDKIAGAALSRFGKTKVDNTE